MTNNWRLEMSLLAKLKLVEAKKTTQISATALRRNKVVARLAEQIELAKAKLDGRTYSVTRQRRVTDEQTGEKRTVETEKRMREWWWVAADGKKMNIVLKYGAKVIEIAKGKTAIEIAGQQELLTTLELLKQAVENGELDAQIEATAGAVRAGFGK